MTLVNTKVIVALLLGILRFSFGTLPIQVCSWLGVYNQSGKRTIKDTRHQYLDYVIMRFQSFGGGVLFATCFLHMMPEVYYCIKELKELGIITTHYPISQLVVSGGFFLIYFLEELSYWLISISPPEPCKRNKKRLNNSVVAVISAEPIPEKEAFNPSLRLQNEGELMVKETKNETVQTRDFDYEEELNLELEEIIEKESKTQQQILRCIVVVLALSLHAIFEGIAIGLQHSETNIWYLFTAMSIHSATILFCIGLEIYLAGTRTRMIIIHMFFLAITSPIGIMIGLAISLTTSALSATKSITIVVLEGLSTGTILYITFFEILNREKERRAHRVKRALYIMAGFGMMAALESLKVPG